jgi:hypothetical protein
LAESFLIGVFKAGELPIPLEDPPPEDLEVCEPGSPESGVWCPFFGVVALEAVKALEAVWWGVLVNLGVPTLFKRLAGGSLTVVPESFRFRFLATSNILSVITKCTELKYTVHNYAIKKSTQCSC